MYKSLLFILSFFSFSCSTSIFQSVLYERNDYTIGLNDSGFPYDYLAEKGRREKGIDLAPDICINCYKDFNINHYKILLNTYFTDHDTFNVSSRIINSLSDDLYSSSLKIEQNLPYLTMKLKVGSENNIGLMFYPYKNRNGAPVLYMFNFLQVDFLRNYVTAYSLNFPVSQLFANAFKSLEYETLIISAKDSTVYYLLKR